MAVRDGTRRATSSGVAAGYHALATELDRNRDRVLERWEERARRIVPAASSQGRSSLRDGLPNLLDELAAELRSNEAVLERDSAKAAEHARQRAGLAGYSVEQLITEYELLLAVLLEVLGERRPLLDGERAALHALLQIRIRASVREYARVHDEERQQARSDLQAAHDALERRVLERTAELARSEARFRGLVEGVKDYAIFTVDRGGQVTSWNAGAQRVNGYSADEILGAHFSILYPEEAKLRDEPMDHLRSAAQEGRFRGEGLRARKNGDLYLADVLITPMYDGRELTGFSKVVQDLTERNLLIQERDLLQSDADRLRVEADYRRRFIATLTHDLRSPISAAKVGAQLIARSPERAEKVRQWALRISDAVDRADRMIVDLLDVSRLDSGQRFVLELEPCNLLHIAEDVCADLSTRHGDHFVLEVEGSTDGHWNGDALWRVLENLLTNAVKYGEPGGRITLRLRRVSDRMLITVHNRGTIIPVEDQAKLFQPYHRTRLAESSGKRGWGLGLTLVRGVVEALDGQIKVESYPEQGTTFTVDLPIEPRK